MIEQLLASGGKPVQLENPLDQYTRVLQIQGAQQTNAFNKMKIADAEREIANRNALNAYYKGAVGPDGKFNLDKFRTDAAAGGHGSLVADVEKGYWDSQKGEADYQKANSDALMAEMKLSGEVLKTIDPADPRAAEKLIAWHQGNHQNPALRPLLDRFGVTPEKGIADIQQAVQTGTLPTLVERMKKGQLTVERQLENHINVLNNGGENVVLATKKFGATEPKAVAKYKITPSPNVPKTTNTTVITNKIEGEGGQEFSKLEAKNLHELKKVAADAPRLAREADRALDLLHSGEVFTGVFANVQKDASRVIKAMGIPIKGVEKTEELMTVLANKTLAAVQSSGLGASNAFSDKDREFVEKAAGGQITLDKATLIRLAEIQREAANFAVRNYNDSAKGAPDSWFKGSGAKRSYPEIAPRKPKGKPAPKGTPTGKRDYTSLWDK